jgi:hypothetical protein
MKIWSLLLDFSKFQQIHFLRFAQFVSRHMVPAFIAASVQLTSTQCVHHGQVTTWSCTAWKKMVCREPGSQFTVHFTESQIQIVL